MNACLVLSDQVASEIQSFFLGANGYQWLDPEATIEFICDNLGEMFAGLLSPETVVDQVLEEDVLDHDSFKGEGALVYNSFYSQLLLITKMIMQEVHDYIPRVRYERYYISFGHVFPSGRLSLSVEHSVC